jgi:hypothetical protein
MTAHLTGARFKSFLLCGKTKSSVLFKVSVHLGFSTRGPLGTMPGIYLHNGKSTADPVLAAAGDESQLAQRVYAFNNRSVIMLPALSRDKQTMSSDEWTRELMVGSTTEGSDGVVFRFAVDICRDGGGAVARERFEWRKFKKGTDAEHPMGGFKLFWVGGDSSRCVAVWELGSGLAKYWDHMFTLRFIDSDASRELGHRWQAMVVVTASRLWMVRLHGKTKRSTIGIGEKIRGDLSSEGK